VRWADHASLAELAGRLKERLARPLPGTDGQLRLSPRPRRGWQPGRIPPGCRDAAALLLVFDRGLAPHTVLTLRHRDLPQHGGQVSLPGGVVEPGETLQAAALRETEEEIGIGRQTIQILGALTPLHIPVSRFVLHPFVGVAAGSPVFAASDGEVERVIEVPLARLVDPALHGEESRERDGTVYEVPFIAVDGEKVWGATAMVLAEWITVLESLRPSPG